MVRELHGGTSIVMYTQYHYVYISIREAVGQGGRAFTVGTANRAPGVKSVILGQRKLRRG